MFFKPWQQYLSRLSQRSAWRSRSTGVAAYCERLEERTLLSTFVVNNGGDSHVESRLSLREAIALANVDAAAGTSDTIVFDASLGSHTIVLTQGQLELSGAGSGVITIDGSSLSTPIRIDALFQSRVFQVDSGVHAVFTNLYLQNGSVNDKNGGTISNSGVLTLSHSTIVDSRVFGNATGGSGGAIENLGMLTLSNVSISENSASKSGGAITNSGTLSVSDSIFASNFANAGGAISNSGTLQLSQSNFIRNTATADGGAIENRVSGHLTIQGGFFDQNRGAAGGAIKNSASAATTLDGVSLTNNTASTFGGAIDNAAGNLTVANSTLDKNTGTNGAGINNNAGTLTIIGSTLSNSFAGEDGGAINNTGGATLTLSNSTLTANFADNGGGIENNASSATVTNSTLSGNTASVSGGGIDNRGGTLRLQSTIVSANSAFSGNGRDVQGVITTDAGYNLLGTAVNNPTNIPTPGVFDVFSDVPGLTALGDYGGPTLTMSLTTNSPAIGAGNPLTSLATDQRGQPRTAPGIDIGAFQTEARALVLTTLEQTFNAGQPVILSLQLRGPDGRPVAVTGASITVNLASSSTGTTFLDTAGNALPGPSITIPVGASSVSFGYRDTQTGTPTLTLSAAGFASVTQQQTVLPAPVSATPTQAIVVGRVLSSYTTGGIQGNLETITFTVYNQQAEPLTGVLLTDELAAGVTLVSASLVAEQNGQRLAWSLGTIPGYDWASVTVTVSLPVATPLTLDTGVQAFAMVNAGAVSDTAPAAKLIQGDVNPNLLRSTPDANTSDPYIQEAAAKLDYNPQNIFTFLDTTIGYNSYAGSLRGARGTLWSNAGNSLDVASLGVALMRASGVPAEYVQGTLAYAQSQQLILSMFPRGFQTVGNIPAGTTTADPANDFRLQGETQNHYWFQFDTGSGMRDADPLMAGAQIGQTFTATQATFTEVPDDLRHKTRIRLTAETYNQASALFGFTDGLSQSLVLDQTFNDVDLIGRPLTIGNFVSSSGLGGLVFSAVTHVYTPYLLIGDEGLPDSLQRAAITGTPFQEVLTNFPLGSQILTGLFLDTTLIGLDFDRPTFTKTLVDRIGYAVRQGLSQSNVSVDPTGPSIITPFDLVTLNILPASQSLAAAQLAQQRSDLESARLDAQTNQSQFDQVHSLISLARAQLASLALHSDQETANLAIGSVAAYFNTPRITAFTSKLVTVDGESTVTLSFDLIRDTIRAIVAPGNNPQVVLGFATARGLFDSALEAILLPTGEGVENHSAMTIIQEAMAQGVNLVTINALNMSLLSTLSLSPDAIARITKNVQDGLTVLAPTQAVMVNGTPRIAWLNFDPDTGEMIAEGEDGGHSGNAEYAAIYVGIYGAFIGVVFTHFTRPPNSPNLTPQEFGKAVVQGFLIGALVGYFIADVLIGGIIATALGVGYDVYIAPRFPIDPPLPPALTDLNVPYPDITPNRSQTTINLASNSVAGAVVGSLQESSVTASGSLAAEWTSTTTNSFLASALTANSASIVNAQGVSVGSGTVGLSTSVPTGLSVSGNDQYSVTGTGSLSFYGAADANLAVSGNWDHYSGTITGNVSIKLTVAAGVLMLNGIPLPAGTYTVTTSSATLSGSGSTTAPQFSGTASITATAGTVNLGPGTGNVTAGGVAIDPSNGATLDGYTGTISITANGTATDTVNLNGTATAVLAVSVPQTLTTDQNTTKTFQATLSASLADNYTVIVQAFPHWTVSIDNTGNVTVTPAPGLQGGSYPIQVIARSTANADLVAQATVMVTITPTAPGITLAVDDDPVFTVPFNGAQVPTAFRAVIHNDGPTTDTFNLTFPNLPPGFVILKSAASVTIPAGQAGIVGIYLQPSGTLPLPGTVISFDVKATSASNPAITKTVTKSFAMPVIDAVAVTSNPTSISSVPGFPATATVTLTNVGNVDSSASVSITTSDGLVVSGGSSTPIAIPLGATVTQTLTLTPDVNAALNSTLTATVHVGPAATQDLFSVLSVAAGDGSANAGQIVSVAAKVFTGVLNPRAAQVLFTVTDHSGNTVFTSTPQSIDLDALPKVTTFDLGDFDTTGLSSGQYTINVAFREAGGQPIAGATGTGTLLINSPVTASLTATPATYSPQDSTTLHATLTIANQALVGGVQTVGTASSVALHGTLAYVAGTQDISIVDISDPAHPTLLSTFGAAQLSPGGTNFVQRTGNGLVVAAQDASSASSFRLLIYSLTDPQHPQLVSNTAIPYQYAQGLVIEGTTALVPTSGVVLTTGGRITDQFGDVVAIDISNPAAPQLKGVLFNDRGTPTGHGTGQHDILPITGTVAYVTSSTSTGNNTQAGTGRILIVNTSNPANLTLSGELGLPGSNQALGIAVDGNHALVVGSTGGLLNNVGDISNSGLTGNATLTLLDITDPLHPTIVGSTVVTQNTFPTRAQDAAAKLQVVDLGQGRYAVSGTLANGKPVILGVDASTPTSLKTSTLTLPVPANGMTVAGDQVYVTSQGGLQVYRAGALFNQTVTAEVVIPNDGATLDLTSFNVPPAQIVNNPSSRTLIFHLNLAPGESRQVAWSSTVNNLLPGQVQVVASGATVKFGNLGTNAQVTLSAIEIAGLPATQSIQIPVRVVVPGVQALASAAVAARQIGNSGLADQFNNLSIALTNLVQDSTNAVYLSQAQASLTSLISQIATDPILAPFAVGLSTGQTALANAATPQAIATAVVNLGTALGTLADAIIDEAAHGFTLGFVNELGVVQPGVPTLFNIALTNHGTATTTYLFSVSGLPAGVTATFSNPSITLAPNASIPFGNNTITLSVSQAGDTLLPGSFTVTATADEAPEITSSVQGTLTLRNEALLVGSVTTDPPFTTPGGQVNVSAKIQSVVNQPREVAVSYVVKDPSGNVLFTLATPVLATLSVASGLTTVDLGNLNTTGFVEGQDTITVTVVDQSSQPLATVTGQGRLTIGLPVSAELSVSPTTVPTGSPTVTNTLHIDATVTLPDPLTLEGHVQTTPTANTVTLFEDATHKLAYVAGNNGIDIVDVSDPSNLVNLGVFGAGDIILGGGTYGRVATIGGTNYLLVGTTLSINANQFTLLVYSLADPLTPTKVSTTVIPYQFLQDMIVRGTTLLVPTAGVFYFPPNSITDQFGSVLSVDVSNPAAPVFRDTLFSNRGAPAGGDTRQNGIVYVNDSIAYVASSSSTGGNINNGVGRVLIVDYSNIADLKLVGQVDLPGTITVADIAIQGNQALVVSSTGAGDLLGLHGNMTLSTLDITDPRNPHLTGNTLTTPDTFGPGKISALPLGNGLFAVSDAIRDGNPELLLVDASDPSSLIVTASPRAVVVNEMDVKGNILYASGPDGLTTYTIGDIVSIPVTASIRVPNTTGVSVVSNSYSTPPAQVIHGATFDTLVFNLNLAFGNTNPAITWQSTVTNLGTNESRPVTLSADLSFTSQNTPGSLTVPGTAVTGTAIVSLTPASQNAQPGEVVNYTVRLTNPTDASVTYYVYLQPESGSYFERLELNHGNGFITIAPQSTLDVPLIVSGASYATLGDNKFTVVAQNQSNSAITGMAPGHLVLAGTPVEPLRADPNSYGVVATLTPSQASAGQGTSADYVLRLINTGSTTLQFFIDIDGLPENVFATFGSGSGSNPQVPPGAANFRDIPISLTTFERLAAGDYPFTVNVTSSQAPGLSSTVEGVFTSVPNSVQVFLDPGVANPGSPLQMSVRNTGTVTDTFDLTVAGPGGLVATLSTNKVTLAPGASQLVTITTSAVNFAVPGLLNLIATATSEANSQVSAFDTTFLVIPTTQGLATHFDVATKVVPVPGTTSFLLLIDNTGNVEDSFTATISGTNGPVTASLIGLDGQPTQTVPTFRIPGLSSAAILLQTDLTELGQGTVTVQVRSLTNPQRSSSSIATVTTNTLAIPTVTVKGGTFTFDGEAHPATGSVTGTNGEDLGVPTFTYTDLNNVTTSNPPVDPGVYTVTASFAGNADYAPASAVATIVISAVQVNATPTNISLSGNTLQENNPAGTVVGTFTSSDPDISDTFTYTFVGGAGSEDNGLFSINSNGQLTTNAPFDFETKHTFLIRVKTTDQGGLSFEKQFTINVTNIDEAPEIVLTPGVRHLPIPVKKQAFDPQATIRDVDSPVIDLANSTIQVKVIQNAGRGDKVRLIKPKRQDLVIKGKNIIYQGALIGERIYGKKGGVPLTVKFNAAAKQPGVEAVLGKIYYRTKATAGTIKQLEFSLSDLASGQTSKTTKDVQLG